MSSQLRAAFSALLSGDVAKLQSTLVPTLNVNEGAGEQTLLHAAAESQGPAIIQLLLSHNANVNNINRNGMTPIQVAIERNNTAATEALLAHNPDLEISDATGARALHWAVQTGNLEVIQTLIKRGVEVSPKAKFDSTPLHIAARAGFAPAVRLLAEANASLEVQSKSLTALHIAAMKGFVDVMKELLSCNASLETKNQRNWTALHIAASAGQVGAAKLLIDSGCHLVPIDVEGNTPNDLALAKGATEISDLIKNAEKQLANQLLSQVTVKPPDNIGLAIFPYTKELFGDRHRAKDLSFVPGDVITDIVKNENNWWEGSCGGQRGLFPSNYISVNFLGRFKCTNTFYATKSDELTIKSGDELDVFEKRPSGWLRAISNGKGGLVPPTHVKKAPAFIAPTQVQVQTKAKSPRTTPVNPPKATISAPVVPQVFPNNPKPLRVAPPSNLPPPPANLLSQAGGPTHLPPPPASLGIPAPATVGPPPPATSGPPPLVALPTVTPKTKVVAPKAAVPKATGPVGLPSMPAAVPVSLPSMPGPPSFPKGGLVDMDMEFGGGKRIPALVKTPTLPKARVLYSYVAQHPGDLELTAGTIIELVKTEGGWWEGTYEGNTGIFPANYVEQI